ncbi:MAG: DUF2892 domain-containing protein [Paracoccaceae bacterium]|jgi:hypothetical protein|nr:DUF2892 domain-containing protein [Paracoccaceae bacterium]
MQANVGNIDRIARAALGVILLIAAFTAGWGTAGTVIAAVVGLVMLGTSAMRFCPAYRLLGMNTCQVK